MKTQANILQACKLCPRKCGVNRLENETGHCRTGKNVKISSFHPHFGEEPELVGSGGSGTIFNCGLLCNFCQNFELSHMGAGSAATEKELAGTMLELQRMGCHNINLVTPTHVVPQIMSALEIAREKGLAVPVIYNSSGYERVRTLRRLAGLIDIYMPDFKFWSPRVAALTCDAPDYPEAARRAIVEMHRQVGNLETDPAGTARRGLLIRHLVLPEGLAGTGHIARFIAGHVSTDTYLNIMPQYRPCGFAPQIRGLDRGLTAKEYQDALITAQNQGLTQIHRF